MYPMVFKSLPPGLHWVGLLRTIRYIVCLTHSYKKYTVNLQKKDNKKLGSMHVVPGTKFI